MKKRGYFVFIVLFISLFFAVLFYYNNQTFFKGNPEDHVATTLFFIPQKEIFTVDESVVVPLLVNSKNSFINVIEGRVTFPQDKLQVTNVSKDDSVFSLWVKGPEFSNEDGMIEFIAGRPTPGFMGSEGNIMTISFMAINEGEAELGITNAQALADDTLGTNVLKKISPSKIVIVSASSKKITADLNGNGKIDGVDFSILLSNMFNYVNASADLNGDGVVNGTDVSILLSRWQLN